MNPRETIHEIDFCSQVASAVNLLVQQNPQVAPFHEARIEGYGKGDEHRKRKDLRFFDDVGRLILCGEVKLPGTLEGRSPFDARLYQDALAKADNARIEHFFTWNVNEFVLWDRSLWDRPMLERRIAYRKLDRLLQNAEEVAREENLRYIKTKFLPELLIELADIIGGRRKEWGLPPDDVFIQILNSHLNWCCEILRTFILENADRDKSFNARVEKWMVDQDWLFNRKDLDDWERAVENMAKTLVYIWSNRLLFYKALLARFPGLPKLALRKTIKRPEEAVLEFGRFFARAVERSGDYEPLLMPDVRDWASELVFRPPDALDVWRGFLKGIEPIDFKVVSSDVVGRIFQKLIDPEERHRYGQHFTGDDVVDIINGFCVRKAEDAVLDPACGSGSFLVRAYYRKRELDPKRPHLDLIGDLFGCDIALYPAHLATLNLAAREINEEANYPRISRMDFFDFDSKRPFCRIPDLPGNLKDVMLPKLDAVVGNPPYVRQEKIDKDKKISYSNLASAGFPDLELSGRSDLHCYFWPAAARFLKSDGYFGFLTSSSWLDVEYGFALQGWIIRHFRIIAIMESAAEPWFEDARVKTCITILQRGEDESTRMSNIVRFVRFNRPLAGFTGSRETGKERKRSEAVLSLRDKILKTEKDYSDQNLRIVVKKQSELWREGVTAAVVLDRLRDEALPDDEKEQETSMVSSATTGQKTSVAPSAMAGSYRAGKWGRYLRAPDFYFEIMQRFRDKFVPLGEIAEIRRGITSGCDAFFMPRDVTKEYLGKFSDDKEFRKNAAGAPRKDVAAGKLKIIESGDGSIHPIESEYLAPEVHSLMKVVRPVVRASDLDRVVLLVGEPMHVLKSKSPWIHRYLQYGIQASFESKKSKPVPVPMRSTCATRERWYDLTGLIKPGIIFWPKAHKYRHIIPANPERLICNCNLYDLSAPNMSPYEQKVLCAILNSTLIGLFKAFYGRFAGTETTLKTEVVDVGFIEIPNPKYAKPRVASKIISAFERMKKRPSGHFVERQLLECTSPEKAEKIARSPIQYADELTQKDRNDLDDAVFELLGVNDMVARKKLTDELYQETAKYFREGRVVELQANENRARSDSRKLGMDELAQDIWDAAELEDALPICEWLVRQPESKVKIDIPEERPIVFPENPLFELKTIKFGLRKGIQQEYYSREQARLVTLLAELGVSGEVKIPVEKGACRILVKQLIDRNESVASRFKQLVESRTSDEKIQSQLLEALMRRFLFGK